MLRMKIDVLPLLKEAGYSSYRLRKENILAQSTIQKFRDRKMVSAETLEWLCEVLHLQPGDILEYIYEKEGDSGVQERFSHDKDRPHTEMVK